MKKFVLYPSGLGNLKIEYEGGCVTGIRLDASLGASTSAEDVEDVGAYALCQIREYLQGGRQSFDFPYRLVGGTVFQRKVWAALQKIPYAARVSYKDIALAIAQPKAMRAVGSAIKANPLLILIPCHRVIRSNGDVGEYVGGRQAKVCLLELEKERRALSKPTPFDKLDA